MPQYFAQPPLPWSISMAEYCVLVWCHSAHTCLINKPINNALGIVTRRLHSTPMNNLFILSGIQLTELCYQKAILSLACCAQESKHLLYESCGNLNQNTYLYLLHCNNQTKHPKILEITVDPKLTFSQHIKITINTAKQTLYILKALISTNKLNKKANHLYIQSYHSLHFEISKHHIESYYIKYQH